MIFRGRRRELQLNSLEACFPVPLNHLSRLVNLALSPQLWLPLAVIGLSGPTATLPLLRAWGKTPVDSRRTTRNVSLVWPFSIVRDYPSAVLRARETNLTVAPLTSRWLHRPSHTACWFPPPCACRDWVVALAPKPDRRTTRLSERGPRGCQRPSASSVRSHLGTIQAKGEQFKMKNKVRDGMSSELLSGSC